MPKLEDEETKTDKVRKCQKNVKTDTVYGEPATTVLNKWGGLVRARAQGSIYFCFFICSNKTRRHIALPQYLALKSLYI